MALPTAHAGPDQSHAHSTLPKAVTLDGSASNSPNGAISTYKWYLLSRPPGSSAAFVDDTLVNPAFTADVVGTYVCFLVVTDVASQVSEGNPRKAPDLAWVHVTITTQHKALSIPGAGQRNWHDEYHAAIVSLDAAVAGFAPDSPKYLLDDATVPAELTNGVAARPKSWSGAGTPRLKFTTPTGNANPAVAIQAHKSSDNDLITVLQLMRDVDGAVGQNNVAGGMDMYLPDDGGGTPLAAAIRWYLPNASNGSADSELRFGITKNDAFGEVLKIDKDGNLELIGAATQKLLKSGTGTLELGTTTINRINFLMNSAIKWFMDTDGDLDMGNNRIQSLGNPTGDTEAAPRLWIQENTGQPFFMFGSSRNAGSGPSTEYMWPGGSQDANSGTEHKFRMPVAGKLKRIEFIREGSAPGGVMTYTVRKNGADTGLVVAPASGETTKSASVDVTFAAGDEIALKVDEDASVNTVSGPFWVTIGYVTA